MDEQVRAFSEAVAAASVACGEAMAENATKPAKAIKPPRGAPNRRAVRPIKPPSVGSPPGRDFALDGKRKSSGPESEDAWLEARLMRVKNSKVVRSVGIRI